MNGCSLRAGTTSQFIRRKFHRRGQTRKRQRGTPQFGTQRALAEEHELWYTLCMKTEAQRLKKNARARLWYHRLPLERRRALYTPRTEDERVAHNAAEREAYRHRTQEQRDKRNAQYRRYYARKRRYDIAKRKVQNAGKQKPDSCEICGKVAKLYFDHDHATQKFRGWICRECNLALGNVKDDPEILRHMIEYLRRGT